MKYRRWYEKHTADLTGRLAVVTGGNSGIGFEAARGLLSLGARLVLACRSTVRGAAAVSRLQTEFPSAEVTLLMLDLAENASIDAFAREMAERYEKIDIFVYFNYFSEFFALSQ